MSEYILEYCGRAKSFTFSRYPSRGVRITLSHANKYYRLGDKVSKEAMSYYRSLAPEVRIRKLATNEITACPKNEKIKPIQEVTPVPVQQEGLEPLDTETIREPETKKKPKPTEKKKKPEAKKPKLSEKTSQNEKPAEIVDTVTVVHEDTPFPASEEKESDLVVNRELPETTDVVNPDMSEQDLCEYVDMHCTEEDVRALAEKLGLNVKRLRSKDSVISRMVSEKYQEVLEAVVK